MTRDELINIMDNIDRAMCLFHWLTFSTEGRPFDVAYLTEFDDEAKDNDEPTLLEQLRTIKKALPHSKEPIPSSAPLAEMIRSDNAVKRYAERLLESYCYFLSTYTYNGIERVSDSIKVSKFTQPLPDDDEAVSEIKKKAFSVWSNVSALLTNFDTYLAEADDNKDQAREKSKGGNRVQSISGYFIDPSKEDDVKKAVTNLSGMALAQKLESYVKQDILYDLPSYGALMKYWGFPKEKEYAYKGAARTIRSKR